MGDTVEAFIRLRGTGICFYRYILAVDKLVGARIWLFDDNYELLAASNYENVLRDRRKCFNEGFS